MVERDTEPVLLRRQGEKYSLHTETRGPVIRSARRNESLKLVDDLADLLTVSATGLNIGGRGVAGGFG